ncbi:MAG: hypothetical protein ABIF12_00600 [bacterium]
MIFIKRLFPVFILIFLFVGKIYSFNSSAFLKKDQPVLGLKQNLTSNQNYLFLKLKLSRFSKPLFLLVNEDQLLEKIVIDFYLRKEINELSFETFKNLPIDQLKKLFFDLKFVKAKDLKVGDAVHSNFTYFDVLGVDRVFIPEKYNVINFLNKQNILFFTFDIYNGYKKYLKKYFSIHHFYLVNKFISSVILANISAELVYGFFQGSYSNDILDKLIKSSGFAFILIELLWISSMISSNEKDDLLVHNEILELINKFNIIPTRLDYLLENKNQLKLQSIPVINLSFLSKKEFDNNQDLSDDQGYQTALFDEVGNYIKDEDGKIAYLSILNVS